MCNCYTAFYETLKISVSSYHMVKELPKELAKELPSPEQMAKLLENIE